MINFFVGVVVDNLFCWINFLLLSYEGFIVLSKEVLRIVLNVFVNLGEL